MLLGVRVTYSECEIVADAGQRLKQVVSSLGDTPDNLSDAAFYTAVRDLNRVVGLLASLPLEAME